MLIIVLERIRNKERKNERKENWLGRLVQSRLNRYYVHFIYKRER